ncbi:hypothetical protein Tco_1527716 [Tanacetum coccineum]
MDNQFRYLGVMVGGNMSRHKTWEDVVLKLRSRLSKWKVKTLSIGGRLTLLKSVLGASPLYNMSIFKAPKGVLKEMESIRNNFFIGADPSDKKITWIAWDKVLASKIKGGLGVSSFFALNRALILKWVWRCGSYEEWILLLARFAVLMRKISITSCLNVTWHKPFCVVFVGGGKIGIFGLVLLTGTRGSRLSSSHPTSRAF